MQPEQDYGTKDWFDARIDWFDPQSGKGMVRLNSGARYTLHFTAIEGIDVNNWAWPKAEDREGLL